LVLAVPADERPIEIRLRQPGSSDLVLPAAFTFIGLGLIVFLAMALIW
jgi:hypothetical protein